jgi:hypothetical protein
MQLDPSDIRLTATATAGASLSAWSRANGTTDAKATADFIAQVKSQTMIWRALTKLLSDLYRERHIAEFNFSNPAFTSELLYSEGYKKALQDVYRLIPQTTEN